MTTILNRHNTPVLGELRSGLTPLRLGGYDKSDLREEVPLPIDFLMNVS